MEGIKVKKEEEFLLWILIVALILKGRKKVFKRAVFESDLSNLLIEITLRKLTPKSFYLESVICYFYNF